MTCECCPLPCFQKKCFFCVLGLCSLFSHYSDNYFWEKVTPDPLKEKKSPNFLFSPFFSRIFQISNQDKVMKLIRYHPPTVVKHV